jgi:hypothetical protein
VSDSNLKKPIDLQDQDPNNYWEQLERLEKLIKGSELKAGVIFSFHSLILGLFVDRLEYISSLLRGNVFLIVLISLWLICVLISIYYCFICFKPQMELKYEKNVFFFMDAVRAFGSIEEYTKKTIEICGDHEKLFQQLSEQIHAESKIIDAKFICVQKSIKYFALSFIFVISFLVFWLISSMIQNP